MATNQIIRIIPTLKVNNRKLNEQFYIDTLGMKPLLEESAFLSLGDQAGIEKMILEESPSMRTRQVEGLKKLAKLIVKVENPLEIESLLSKMESVPRLYKGEKGYAFEVLSPEGDLVLLHAENDRESLTLVEDQPEFVVNPDMTYLSHFEISMELHLPEGSTSLLDQTELADSVVFKDGQGQDLLIENSVTWDLSMLKFQVRNLDIVSLRQKFEAVGYFVPKSEKFFLSKDNNNIELWFEEA